MRSADAVLLAVPLYNFGIPQHVKTWIDVVLAGAESADEALLAGKPAVLVVVRGGAYGAGTPRAGWDHSTGYLRRIIADVWGADLTLVEREFTLVGVNPALDDFNDLAGQFKDAAHAAAAQAGKALAASVTPPQRIGGHRRAELVAPPLDVLADRPGRSTGLNACAQPRPLAMAVTDRTAPVVSLAPCTYRPYGAPVLACRHG